MNDLDIEKEILDFAKQENKKFDPKKKINPTISLKLLDQKIFFEEQERMYLVDRVLLRQFLFPERAHAILDKELLQSLDTEDLKCIIESYEVSEEDISRITLKISDEDLEKKI